MAFKGVVQKHFGSIIRSAAACLAGFFATIHDFLAEHQRHSISGMGHDELILYRSGDEYRKGFPVIPRVLRGGCEGLRCECNFVGAVCGLFGSHIFSQKKSRPLEVLKHFPRATSLAPGILRTGLNSL